MKTATRIYFKQPRIIKAGALTIKVSWCLDEDADLSYLNQDYADCSSDERAKYKAQDNARVEAFNRDEWVMVFCLVEVSIKTAMNWAVPFVVARASLSGIESDSAPAYLAQVERELIEEAHADLKLTREAFDKLPR